MRRVLVVQPGLNPPGGGNAVAAWMLEALSPDHALTLLTWERPDFKRIDAHYGTHLASADLRVEQPGFVPRTVVDATGLPLRLLRHAWLDRLARERAPRFDLLVSAHDEAALGTKGLQYVHCPVLPDALRRPGPARTSAAARAYARAVATLTGYDLDGIRRTPALTNSEWTARQLAEAHGIRSTVLYPPVDAEPFAADAPREGVLAIGRFTWDKRFEAIAAIVQALRDRGHDLRLTIAGAAERTPAERRYADALVARLRARPWITVHADVDRATLRGLLGRHRFGLHAKEDEHFGLAPAEMALSGCLPLVHASGGQVEIVDADARLLFRTEDEAVTRLEALLASPSLERELRGRVQARAARFSVATFRERFRSLVDQASAS